MSASIPAGFVESENDSRSLPVEARAVLLLAEPGEDLLALVRALPQRDYFGLRVENLDELGLSPRFGFVASSKLDRISELTRGSRPCFVAALLGPSEGEGPALAAGAHLTLRRPFSVSDAFSALDRLRLMRERWVAASEAIARDRTNVSVPVVEGLVAALQHELRNPLAAALANVEYLRDAGSTPSERASIAEDAHHCLRRMTAVLDVVSSLVDGKKLELQTVVLRDAVAAAASSIGIRCIVDGERDVVGWGNQQLIERVLRALFDDIAGRTTDRLPMRVRVYLTSTEARISIRDTSGSCGPESKAFEPVLRLGGDERSGLSLPLVRHAIARMGGTITLSNTGNGRVFRVRLRRRQNHSLGGGM